MIAIIGILIALLLPAVQAAREAARRVRCSNHLKQIGVAMLAHESAHGFLPSGGWGFWWTGDPDRGTGENQPGGWTFAVLPYLELEVVHAMGTDGQPDAITAVQREGAVQRDQSPVATFVCPSRRSSILYPRPGNRQYKNSGPYSEASPLDYCANAGSGPPDEYDVGPGSIADAAGYDWPTNFNGPIFTHNETRLSDITDGTSVTYLVGEKYLPTDDYYNGKDAGDDRGIYEGCGCDVNRFCTYTSDNVSRTFPPRQDTPGLELYYSFGSPHPGGCGFVFCDGSVRAIAYEIEPLVHSLLGNMEDGHAIEPGKYE